MKHGIFIVTVLAVLCVASLMACGNFSGTAHVPVEAIYEVEVVGPYNGDIMVDNITTGVQSLDAIELTANTIYAGGLVNGVPFDATFGIGPDCTAPVLFPPLTLTEGNAVAITDRATLDSILSMVQASQVYICADVPEFVNMDLGIRIAAMAEKPL